MFDVRGECTFVTGAPPASDWPPPSGSPRPAPAPPSSAGAEARLPVAAVVWHNDGYGEIRNAMAGSRVPRVGTDPLAPDFPALARSYGCAGVRARGPEQLRAALEEAQEAGVPTVIEVRQGDWLSLPSGQWYG